MVGIDRCMGFSLASQGERFSFGSENQGVQLRFREAGRTVLPHVMHDPT
jgi:hypothetical protein